MRVSCWLMGLLGITAIPCIAAGDCASPGIQLIPGRHTANLSPRARIWLRVPVQRLMRESRQRQRSIVRSLVRITSLNSPERISLRVRRRHSGTEWTTWMMTPSRRLKIGERYQLDLVKRTSTLSRVFRVRPKIVTGFARRAGVRWSYHTPENCAPRRTLQVSLRGGRADLIQILVRTRGRRMRPVAMLFTVPGRDKTIVGWLPRSLALRLVDSSGIWIKPLSLSGRSGPLIGPIRVASGRKPLSKSPSKTD